MCENKTDFPEQVELFTQKAIETIKNEIGDMAAYGSPSREKFIAVGNGPDGVYVLRENTKGDPDDDVPVDEHSVEFTLYLLNKQFHSLIPSYTDLLLAYFTLYSFVSSAFKSYKDRDGTTVRINPNSPNFTRACMRFVEIWDKTFSSCDAVVLYSRPNTGKLYVSYVTFDDDDLK